MARAIQGIGGAVLSAVALSLLMNLFTGASDRAKAMGIFGFVSAGGGSVGVLLGGFLTGAFDWHWIFLINIPIGVAVIALCLALVPKGAGTATHKNLDVFGAITVTTSLMLAVYAIVGGNETGWTSPQTLLLLAASIMLLGAFLWIESHVHAPLMPLSLFKVRSVSISNIVGVLWAAGLFAWFFISALYLQIILSYTPMQVGLAFLPANVIMAVFSLGLSAKIVMRYGIKWPLSLGLLMAAFGLMLFARAPIDGSFLIDILPSMILLGIGGGIAFNPLFLVAMSDVPQDESGLASGVINTSFMMGGALGLAILASIAAARANSLLASGNDLIGSSSEQMSALLGGYHVAFFVGALFAAAAALISALFLRGGLPTQTQEAH